MKFHPLLVVGAIIVSAGAGYYLRSAFPTPFFGNGPAAGKEAPEEAADESARLRRTLEALEAENDIRRIIERREEDLLARMAADTRPERAELTDREPMLVDKVSAEPFYDDLAPHGEWLGTDDYGDVWQPQEAQDPNWRPYTNGGWAYTNLGLTWDSLEPWGDIPYHYGRWVDLDSPGWCWVPGYDWAPAWVSWRCNDHYIGWAPLPPCVPWRTACGIGSWVDACGGLGPGSYCFLPSRHFGATDCRTVLCARSESSVHFGRTRNVTRLTSKPGGGANASTILEGPAARRLAALGVKDMRYRRLNFVDGPTGASNDDAATLSVRRLTRLSARQNPAAGSAAPASKASRQLGRSSSVDAWQEVGDVKAVAGARRKVFSEAQQSFRGLPRLVPPVGSATPPGRPHKAGAVARAERAREPLGAQRDSLSSQRLADLLRRESGSRALLAREVRPSRRDGTSTQAVERFTALTARPNEATGLARRRQTAEVHAIRKQQQQVMRWQPRARSGLEQPPQALAQAQSDQRERYAADHRDRFPRTQAIAAPQQYQAAAGRQAFAENQRRQIQLRQHQQFAQRQQTEHARAQTMIAAHRQAENYHRSQVAQARRNTQPQARQVAHRQPPQARQIAAVSRQNVAPRQHQRTQIQQAPARANHAASRPQASSRPRAQSSAPRQGAHSGKQGR